MHGRQGVVPCDGLVGGGCTGRCTDGSIRGRGCLGTSLRINTNDRETWITIMCMIVDGREGQVQLELGRVHVGGM